MALTCITEIEVDIEGQADTLYSGGKWKPGVVLRENYNNDQVIISIHHPSVNDVSGPFLQRQTDINCLSRGIFVYVGPFDRRMADELSTSLRYYYISRNSS